MPVKPRTPADQTAPPVVDGATPFEVDVEPLESEADDEFAAGRPSLIGSLLADRYRVHHLIGVGGMGAVYYAEHVAMQKPVAVKVLHRELMVLPEVVARFEREAIAAGRINDPHVVTATDFGRLDDGSCYLALEYVEGKSLATELDGGPMPAVRALKIARQIFQALAAAHAAGIVHRDLKPENVLLVQRPDEADFVKVLDFGIAKVTVDEQKRPGKSVPGGVLTRMGSVFGTPQYMAPEQAAGQEVDLRADLYTVGIILYEMLAGTPPFVADEVARVLAMHLTQPPPELPPRVEPGAAAFVLQLLAKSPEQRPQTAEEAILRCDQALRQLGVSHPSFAAILDERGSFAEAMEQLRGSAATNPDLAPRLVGAPEPLAVVPKPALAPRSSKLWIMLAALLAVILPTVALVVVMPRLAAPALAPSASASSDQREPAIDPRMVELLAEAASGDRDALAELARRPAASRAPAEWVALGRGYLASGDVKRSLDAYQQALAADPSLSSDPMVKSHIRALARNKDTADAAVRLAAERLGSHGADILYDVWTSTKDRTPITELARKLLHGDVLRHATPPLRIAIDLRAALEQPEPARCAAVKELLPRAMLDGDHRTWRVLERLQKRTGCGAKGRDDCYPCLRKGRGFDDAFVQARSRPGPDFK